MNQITIHETDSALVERITQLAEKKGVPPEEEARQLLRWAVARVEESEQMDFEPNQRGRMLSHEEFVRKAEEISRRIGPVDVDSAEFLRSQRDKA